MSTFSNECRLLLDSYPAKNVTAIPILLAKNAKVCKIKIKNDKIKQIPKEKR